MLSRAVEAFRIGWRAGANALRTRPRRSSADAGGRHLLIVSWHFPPESATGAQLPAFLARQALRTGWRITAVCGPVPPHPSEQGLSALAMLPPGVRLVRARGWQDDLGHFHPQFFHRFSPRVDGGFAESESLAAAAFESLDRDPPSHVFATGPVFGNFLVGRRLARHFDVPLCLQYRDEWTVMRPSFVGASSRDQERERACLVDADLVTFVTEGKSALYHEAFPMLRSKRTLVIPNGWDPEVTGLAAHGSTHLAHLRDRLVIAFTGRATAEIPLAPFLKVLGAVLDGSAAWRERLTLFIAGNQSAETTATLDQFAARHPGVLERRPGLPQTTAIEIMREASILLLLNNTRHEGVVPLKTFDYMASGTPILAFGLTGAGRDILAATEAGVAVPEADSDALTAGLEQLSGRPRNDWNGPRRTSWCRANDRSVLFGRLLDTIGQLHPHTGRAP
jgi:glycosyltransferase involved in cell wall biosynthesis